MNNQTFSAIYSSGTVLSENEIKDMELARCQKALTFLKAKVRPDIMEFLSEELAITTKRSEEYVNLSNGEWKSASVLVNMPNLSGQEHHTWFMEAVKDEIKLQKAHPDHYMNAAFSSEKLMVKIIENVGEDDLPWYLLGTFVAADTVPFERDLEYPTVFCLKAKSQNDVTILFAAHEYKVNENNIGQIKLTIILPKAAPDSILLGHLNHFSIEFRNWYLAALVSLNRC